MRLRITIPETALRTAVRYFLLAIAIPCLGFYGYVSLERELYQAAESRQFDQALDRDATAITAVGDESALIGSAERLARRSTSSSRTSSPTDVLGRLSVPRLHLSAMVREGVDRHTLDEIRFSTPGGDFRYAVDSLIIVEADNVAVLAPSSGNVLTLVTCYPFSYIGSAPKRFVVRAGQVSPQPVSSSAVE